MNIKARQTIEYNPLQTFHWSILSHEYFDALACTFVKESCSETQGKDRYILAIEAFTIRPILDITLFFFKVAGCSYALFGLKRK